MPLMNTCKNTLGSARKASIRGNSPRGSVADRNPPNIGTTGEVGQAYNVKDRKGGVSIARNRGKIPKNLFFYPNFQEI